MSPSDALYNVSKLATSLTKLLRKISDRGPARNFEMDGSIQTSPSEPCVRRRRDAG